MHLTGIFFFHLVRLTNCELVKLPINFSATVEKKSMEKKRLVTAECNNINYIESQCAATEKEVIITYCEKGIEEEKKSERKREGERKTYLKLGNKYGCGRCEATTSSFFDSPLDVLANALILVIAKICRCVASSRNETMKR